MSNVFDSMMTSQARYDWISTHAAPYTNKLTATDLRVILAEKGN